MSKHAGFTLVEILLSLALLAGLAGLTLPVYQSFQNRNNLRTSTLSVVDSLRQARSFARANQHDAGWSVRITNGEVLLFAGDDYVNRNADYDRPVVLPETLNPSGQTTYYFAPVTGYVDDTGSVTLELLEEETNVTVNEKGMIDY